MNAHNRTLGLNCNSIRVPFLFVLVPAYTRVKDTLRQSQARQDAIVDVIYALSSIDGRW